MQYIKPEVADLASEQWGMITAAQARQRGESLRTLARLAQRDILERMAHGVYRLAGTPPSPLDDLRAAWLSLDPERTVSERLRDEKITVVSHRSAAKAQGLGDLDADVYEFTSPGRKQSRRTDIRLSKATLESSDWSVIDGLPVTTIARTITDLAQRQTDGGHMASVVRDALVKLHFDDQTIIQALTPYAHYYGVPHEQGKILFLRFLQDAGLPELIHGAVIRQVQSEQPGSSVPELINSRHSRRVAEILVEVLTLNQQHINPVSSTINEENGY